MLWLASFVQLLHFIAVPKIRLFARYALEITGIQWFNN